MRKILCTIVLALGLAGCATLTGNSATPSTITTAQQTAEQVVYGFEAAFQATPPIVDALLKNGNITPHTYNTQILPAYNQGLGSLNVLIAALKAAETAGQDPNSVTAYTTALAQFLTDKGTMDNLLAAFGKGEITQ